MPFVQVNVKQQIEERRQNNPEFKKLWDESKREKSPKGLSFDDFLKEYYSEKEIEKLRHHAIKEYHRELRRRKRRMKKLKEIGKNCQS